MQQVKKDRRNNQHKKEERLKVVRIRERGKIEADCMIKILKSAISKYN
jgi:hypothetical protein